MLSVTSLVMALAQDHLDAFAVCYQKAVDRLNRVSRTVCMFATLMRRQAKLEAGVQLCHHMISYGDKPNDFDSICKCECGLSFYTLFCSPCITITHLVPDF